MVSALFHPLNIFILGLGAGFALPLLANIGSHAPRAGFAVALAGMFVVTVASLIALGGDMPAIEIFTGGGLPPFTINLRFGIAEGFFVLCINAIAILGAWQMWPRLRESYSAMLLFLILTMGLSGMVMTRDLFNQFVFLEIASIATYGLFGLQGGSAALGASFKYIMATVVASSFFLLGTTLLYYVTGTLNIDALIEGRAAIAGPVGSAALLLLLGCLLIELKPFPANGWGLDVYETSVSGVAALVSVSVSAGILFTLFKLSPLFENQLGLIALSGGVTFLASNLIGLRQTNVQRLLGYSSIGQIGLLTLAFALLNQLDAQAAIPLVCGGLFLNHLLAKAGLFWLAGAVERPQMDDWSSLARSPLLLVVFAILIVAIAGLPPFPGFWAKWQLLMVLSADGRAIWIFVILLGSLFEAAYMFRWFGRALVPGDRAIQNLSAGLPSAAVAAFLLVCGGVATAAVAGAASSWLFVPLCAGVLLYAGDALPGRVKSVAMLTVVLIGGVALIRDLSGLSSLVAWLLLAGSLVIAAAGLYRDDRRTGHHALLAIMLLAIPALTRSTTSLEFFFCWELVTLSSYFLIAQGRDAGRYLLPYILFSLASAYCLMAGFGVAYSATGTIALSAFGEGGSATADAFVLLAIGCLIKAAALGVHVWLPGAYAEADDDVTAMLSAVVSKVPMFALLIGTYAAIRSDIGLDLAHLMAWIGLVTTAAGAVMAIYQQDMKRMLAYSSMSQIGYIVTAIALMNHLGWVTALYLIANHLMVKGILFLAVAGVYLRISTRLLSQAGGLRSRMPVTFGTVLIAVVSMSGLPPLAGFGGKWLLLSAMVDRGWYGLAALGFLATFLGFLYMIRLVHTLFLGPRQQKYDSVEEAPRALLIPQLILVAGILVLSFYPKLFMESVSEAIDPYFASTLVWEGMSLETIYGYWNPVPIMIAAVVVALVLAFMFWLFYRAKSGTNARRSAPVPSGRGNGPSGLTRFYLFYRRWLGRLVRLLDLSPWHRLAEGTLQLAGAARRIYTGNGQSYVLYILYFFLWLYVSGGGI